MQRITLKHHANYPLPSPPTRITAAALLPDEARTRQSPRKLADAELWERPKARQEPLWSHGLRAWRPGAAIGPSCADKAQAHASVEAVAVPDMDVAPPPALTMIMRPKLPVAVGSLVPLPMLDERHMASASNVCTPRHARTPRRAIMRRTPLSAVSPRGSRQEGGAHGGPSAIGEVRVVRPSPSPRRAKLLDGLLRSHGDESTGGTPILPPLPPPPLPLSALDEQVLACALRDPACALALAATRHTGLSRIGKRPPPTQTHLDDLGNRGGWSGTVSRADLV